MWSHEAADSVVSGLWGLGGGQKMITISHKSGVEELFGEPGDLDSGPQQILFVKTPFRHPKGMLYKFMGFCPQIAPRKSQTKRSCCCCCFLTEEVLHNYLPIVPETKQLNSCCPFRDFVWTCDYVGKLVHTYCIVISSSKRRILITLCTMFVPLQTCHPSQSIQPHREADFTTCHDKICFTRWQEAPGSCFNSFYSWLLWVGCSFECEPPASSLHIFRGKDQGAGDVKEFSLRRWRATVSQSGQCWA